MPMGLDCLAGRLGKSLSCYSAWGVEVVETSFDGGLKSNIAAATYHGRCHDSAIYPVFAMGGREWRIVSSRRNGLAVRSFTPSRNIAGRPSGAIRVRNCRRFRLAGAPVPSRADQPEAAVASGPMFAISGPTRRGPRRGSTKTLRRPRAPRRRIGGTTELDGTRLAAGEPIDRVLHQLKYPCSSSICA